MEWDGAESCISSTSESDGGNCAADADDEQSDWVGYAPSVTEGDFDPLDERRGRRLQQKLQMSQLQRRLERFALEGGRGEMGIEFRIKDRPNSIQVLFYCGVIHRICNSILMSRHWSCIKVSMSVG
ncbi:unnamed protein product [Heligmosomoides polygyrus]|uniref:Phosducin domain-containing protein n=1 Tax=Heligmosomoides polygyrus TaxID=6339 RepID=A0A3P8A3V3_HELPZ|nr:unnamed protein product [Heligmosomoides polygyrus]